MDQTKSIGSTLLECVAPIAFLLFLSFCVVSCNKQVATPEDTKYIKDFHVLNFYQQNDLPKENKLNLFVDYSTCCAMGQHSRFFQEVSASLVARTTDYYSIRGAQIQKEDLVQMDVYTRLRNIVEVNYAELKEAANRMADADCESVLLTDGEYFTPSIAKGHDNDPWLTDALKKWILKGHDVHFISEPYIEGTAAKKRFYILFTDDRMPNNIYERIRSTVDFRRFPDVDEFHISASHPKLRGEGNNGSVQNEILQSKSQGFGTMEIEDWDGCDWKTIEDNIVNAMDESTGEALANGASVIELSIDKNSFGCYRIKSLDVKVYNINQEYSDFYAAKETGEKPSRLENTPTEIENFMIVDKNEFDKHSKINIHFNQEWFDPKVLSGSPYNYFKIDLCIGAAEPIFAAHEAMFEFESISMPSTRNVSVASSIKQCLADDEVRAKIAGQVIYTIYVKSEKN